ncbi:MAG: YbfB/YjiJ family MFS transporter [Rhodospirillaceae bacterium]
MFVAMGLGRFSYGAMVPALVTDGQLSAGEAGWIGGINLAAYFLGAFITDACRARWPVGRVLMVSVLASLVALTASALPWGFAWLGFWRGLVGVTAGLIMVLGLALATDTAPADRRAMAAGILFSGVGVGIFFSGVLVPWLLGHGIAWAWSGIAAVGVVGLSVAGYGWRGLGTGTPTRQPSPGIGQLLACEPHRRGLAVAYFLFSFGITPHTLYWVDFLARKLDLGLALAGTHWATVGVFAVLGPWAAGWVARHAELRWAVGGAFVILGIGVAAPALAVWAPVLWVSTVIFGAQPGLTTVTSARARELSDSASVAALLRVLIMSSALGAAIGGIVFPALFAASGRYDVLFALAGAGMIVAAFATHLGLPDRRRQAS